MRFINLGRLNIRKRNLCTSTLVSLSDVQPPSVYKSHILNGPINKLYLLITCQAKKKKNAETFILARSLCFLLYFSMNYRDFSVKSKLIISLFQTVKLSLPISLFQKIGFS